MKAILISLILFFSAHLAVAQDKNYSINSGQSEILWIGKKVGGEHQGTVEVLKSEIQLNKNKPVRGSITIDMNSLKITDIESESSRQKLHEVLVADGFFEIHNYPTAHFEFEQVEKLGIDQYLLIGELKIKSKKIAAKIPIRMIGDVNQWIAVGEFDINRINYDIHYEGGFFSSLGDKAIKDQFQIQFKLVYFPEN